MPCNDSIHATSVYMLPTRNGLTFQGVMQYAVRQIGAPEKINEPISTLYIVSDCLL